MPWNHAIAVMFSPRWIEENQSAILMDFPRIPLPTTIDTLGSSAALGARLAKLLNPDKAVSGITAGTLDAPFAVLAAISREGGGSLAAGELAISAGWGRGGRGKPVMPGPGRLTERAAYAADELDALAAAAQARGEAVDDLVRRLGPPVDVWLNAAAFWRCVPRAVWDYRIGGYQVFKKWLSYREAVVLGRPLTPAEAREASGIVRRLAAIVLMQPELDANYAAIRDAAWPWPRPASDD